MYPEIFVLQISKIRFIRSRPSQAAVIQMKPSQIAFLIHVIKSKAYLFSSSKTFQMSLWLKDHPKIFYYNLENSKLYSRTFYILLEHMCPHGFYIFYWYHHCVLITYNKIIQFPWELKRNTLIMPSSRTF